MWSLLEGVQSVQCFVVMFFSHLQVQNDITYQHLIMDVKCQFQFAPSSEIFTSQM